VGPRVRYRCHPDTVGIWTGAAGHERQRRPTNCAGGGPATRGSSRRRCASRLTGRSTSAHASDTVLFACAAVDNHNTIAPDDAVTVANGYTDVTARDDILAHDLKFAASRTAGDHTHRNGDECAISAIGRAGIKPSIAAVTDVQSITHAQPVTYA
jgi:hypothetical protein